MKEVLYDVIKTQFYEKSQIWHIITISFDAKEGIFSST